MTNLQITATETTVKTVDREMNMTEAQRIAKEAGDDGMLFEYDGESLEDRCERHGSAIERAGKDMWRFAFKDGSAITGNSAVWDVEGFEEYVMECTEI